MVVYFFHRFNLQKSTPKVLILNKLDVNKVKHFKNLIKNTWIIRYPHKLWAFFLCQSILQSLKAQLTNFVLTGAVVYKSLFPLLVLPTY